MTSLTVAAVQLVASDSPADNLEQVRSGTREAAAAGAALVVFPEATMACFGTSLRDIAQPLDGEFAEGVRAVATEHDLTVVVGMFEPADDGRVYNTVLATGPGDEAAYRKIHLYDAFGSMESAVVKPGSDHVVIDVAGVAVGLATCYDIRFADQFTALGRAGAQVIAVPTSWGDGPGKAAQWDTLVRARAMDAQAWLLGCGQAWVPGQGTDPLGIGRSALVDPMGQVRGQLGHDAGLLVGTIDTAMVEATRARIPIL